MAKRRRKKPNIPEAAMQHALEEAGVDADIDASDDDASEEVVAEVSNASVSKPAPTANGQARRRRREVSAAKLEKRKSQGTLDHDYIADLLAHPTKTVTEEELHADYGYVLKDLRNMGILAAVLFVGLIGIALVIL